MFKTEQTKVGVKQRGSMELLRSNSPDTGITVSVQTSAGSPKKGSDIKETFILARFLELK